MVALHTSPIVTQAVGELAAQIDSGDVVVKPILVLEKVCQRIKEDKAKRPPREAPWEAEKRIRGERFLAMVRGEVPLA